MPHLDPNRQQSAAAAFVQSAGAKLLIIGINAATGILTARALAPAGRGELSAMILWYTLLASAFTFGVPSALTFQIRKRPEYKSELTGAALLVSVTLSLVVSVVGYFGLPHWIPQYSPEVLFYARLFLLNTPIAAIFIVGRAAVESEGGFGASNLSLIGPPILTLTALGVLAYLHALTPVSAAWAYVPAGIPPLFGLVYTLRKNFAPRFTHLRQSLRWLLSYGIRSYGIDLCGTMSLYVDQALVVRILRPNLMGVYVVALSLSRMLNAFHTAVVMVLFPKAVSRSPEEVLDMTGRAARMTTLITALCGSVIVLAGPHLLVFLYGQQYREAAGILRILVVEVVLAGATQVMSQAFMALARPGVITALQALGLLLTIPLMLLLVPRFGVTGAAVSLLISTSARFLFVMASFSRFLDFRAPRLLVTSADLRFLGVVLLKCVRSLSLSAAAAEGVS